MDMIGGSEWDVLWSLFFFFRFLWSWSCVAVTIDCVTSKNIRQTDILSLGLEFPKKDLLHLLFLPRFIGRRRQDERFLRRAQLLTVEQHII